MRNTTLPKLTSQGLELETSAESFGLLRDSTDVLEDPGTLRERMAEDGYLYLPGYLDFKPANYWKWAQREDLVSDDSYPDPSDPEAHIGAGMSRDLMRSLGDGAPWVLMEQTTVRVNWRGRNVPKQPNELRLWTYGAVARGAEGIMFFQWRQSRAGAEKFHSAMVPHVPVEDSRSWHEVTRLGAELGKLDELLGARGEAETAILLNWESWWALELDSKPSTAVRMLEGVYSFYTPLYEANVPVDFAYPASDLSFYKLVVAPNLYLVTDDSAENIRRFVTNGGTLLMSFFSGIVDARDHIPLGGYPAPFRELLGLQIEDFVPYTQDFYAGTPTVTRHTFGEGAAYYLGTRPEESYTRSLLQRVCEEAGVRPAAEVPPGVDAVRRKTEDASFLFVLNHNEEPVEVPLPNAGRDLLTGKEHSSNLVLEPLEVAVLKERG